MKLKEKSLVQLLSPEWVQDLAFTIDVTAHFNCLSRFLQGCNKVASEYYDNIRAFMSMHHLWEMQLSNNNPSHFPCLDDLYNAEGAESLFQLKEEISSLFHEFEQRFQVCHELETEFKFFCIPFL